MNRKLILILIIATILRFYNINKPVVPTIDQAWFFDSAKSSLKTGTFPLLGITTSIIWLHQGPLYTYLLIPTITNAQYFTAILGVLTVFLVYRLGGWEAAFVIAISPLSVMISRTPYHTSVIPFFLALFFVLLSKNKSFLSGLFLGFLYQLHLLTFIFWPFVLKRTLRPLSVVSGFLLGILPFLLAGPVATGGIFVWFIYKTIFGFPATNSLSFYANSLSQFTVPLLIPKFTYGQGSDAYFTLGIIPLALGLGFFLKKLPKYPKYLLCLVALVLNTVKIILC